MKKLLTLLLFFLLFAVLAFFFVNIYAEKISGNIESNIKRALNTSKHEGVKVKMDGRNVVLSGEVESNIQRKKVLSAAESVFGIGEIKNSIKIAERPIVALQPAKLELPEIEEAVDVQVVGIKKIEPTEKMHQIAQAEIDYAPALPPEPKKDDKREIEENKGNEELREPSGEDLGEEKQEKSQEIEATSKKGKTVTPEKKVDEVEKPDSDLENEETQLVQAEKDKTTESKEGKNDEPLLQDKLKKDIKKSEEKKPVNNVNPTTKTEPVKAEAIATKEKIQKNNKQQTEKIKATGLASAVKNVSVRNKPDDVKAESKNSSLKQAQHCQTRINSVLNRSPIMFRPGTEFIEFRTGNTLTEIASILKLCPNTQVQVIGYGYDETAKLRAGNIAMLLRDIEQIEQKISIRQVNRAPTVSPVTLNIISK